MKKLIYILLASLAIVLFSCVGEKQKLYQQQLQQKQQGYDSLYSEIENSDSMILFREGNFDYIFTNNRAKDIWAFIRIAKHELRVHDICLVINNSYSFSPSDSAEIYLGYNLDSLNYKSTVSKLLINPIWMYMREYRTDEKNIAIKANDEIERLLYNLNDSNIILAEIPKGEFHTNITVEYNELLNNHRHLFYFNDSLDIKKLIQVRDYYKRFKELDDIVNPVK